MIRLARFTPILAALAAAALLASPRLARADFELILTSGSQTETFTGAGGTLNVTNTTINGYNVQFLGGTSNSPGTGGNASLVINSFEIQNVSSTGSLTATLIDTGFTSPGGKPLIVQSLMTGAVQNVPGTTVAFNTYANASNSQSGLGTLLTTDSATPSGTANALPFGGTTMYSTFTPNGSSPYSLTDQLVFSAPIGGDMNNFTGSLNLSPVPAPPAIVMALSALPLLGLGRWLRRFRA